MKNFLSLPCAVLLAAAVAPVHASTINLASNGQWNEFQVDSLLAPSGSLTAWIDPVDSSPISFQFTIANNTFGTLTVVDGAAAGDTFHVTNFGSALGDTSSVPITDFSSAVNVGFDYDAALLDPHNFSRAVFTLTPGTYSIGGVLFQSVLDGGTALEATFGAVKLNITPVPAPAALISLITGLTTLGCSAWRRRA